MNLAYCTDAKYLPHTATALRSAWFHNPTARFFVLTDSVPESERRKLARMATGLGVRLDIFELSELTDSALPVSNMPGVTPTTYSKLLLSTILPSDIDKILYLDADTIVTGSLEDLYATDLNSRPLAAVRDEGMKRNRQFLPYMESHGMSPESYFNAGVMLLNLEYLRDEGLDKTLLTYAHEHDVDLMYADQCAFNAVIKAGYIQLNKKWNYQLPDFDGIQELPPVVHFCGSHKPWNMGMPHPIRVLYQKHRKKTPWRYYLPNKCNPETIYWEVMLRIYRLVGIEKRANSIKKFSIKLPV